MGDNLGDDLDDDLDDNVGDLGDNIGDNVDAAAVGTLVGMSAVVFDARRDAAAVVGVADVFAETMFVVAIAAAAFAGVDCDRSLDVNAETERECDAFNLVEGEEEGEEEVEVEEEEEMSEEEFLNLPETENPLLFRTFSSANFLSIENDIGRLSELLLDSKLKEGEDPGQRLELEFVPPDGFSKP